MLPIDNKRRSLIGLAAVSGGLAFLASSGSRASAAEHGDLAARLARLEDEAALKRLVDTFSNLADQRDIAAQVQLFTEDAVVQSYSGGNLTSTLRGRAELAERFGAFLSNFTTIYHMNGQQTVTIEGDQATGTAYCLVVLIGQQEGRTMRRTSGVRYDDRYQRVGGQWLIAQRTSYFDWNAIEEVPA